MTRAKLVLSAERIGGAVASWLVPSGKEVREGQPILRYKAGSTEKEYLAPISGSLSWSTLLDGALDFCTHEELLSGKLCLRCGFDVSTLSRKAQELVAAHRSSTMQGYRMRGGTGHSITMSDARAREADVRKLTRLRSARKLTLVLDLDHTLLHATQDSRAPALVDNHPQLRGLRGSEVFTFSDAMHTITVKLRPGVRRFLSRMAELFELQVDTKGTRAYAARIVGILDPSGKLFGDRIVSRCDAAMRVKQSTAWLHRALQDDSMVLIVDDREDMWPGAGNLVVVEPYHFWGRELGDDVNNRSGAAIAAAAALPAATVPAASAAGGAAAVAGGFSSVAGGAAAVAGGFSSSSGTGVASTAAGSGAGAGAASAAAPASSAADAAALSLASSTGLSDASADEYDPLQHAQAAGLPLAAPAVLSASLAAAAAAAAAAAGSVIVDAPALDASAAQPAPAAASAGADSDAPLVGSKRSRSQMLANSPPSASVEAAEPSGRSESAPAEAAAAAVGDCDGVRSSSAIADGASAMAVDTRASAGTAAASTSAASDASHVVAAPAPAEIVASAAAAPALAPAPPPPQHWAASISPAELAARWCGEPPYAEQLDDVAVLLARAHAQYYRLYDQQQGQGQGKGQGKGQLPLDLAAVGGAGATLSSSTATSAAESMGNSSGAGAALRAPEAAAAEDAAPLVSPATIAADAAALHEIYLDDPSLGRSATKVAASAATAAAAAGAGAGAGAAAAVSDPATTELAKQFLSGASACSSSLSSAHPQQHDCAPQQPAFPMDTSAILQGLYRSVLRGVCVVFSGVFPLDVDAARQLLYQRCLAFGACVADSVEPKIVHGCHFRREAATAAAAGADPMASSGSSAAAAAGSSTESAGTAAVAGSSLASERSTDGSAPSGGLHTGAAASNGSAASASGSSSGYALAGARREFNGSITSLGAVVTHVVARRAGTQKIHDAVLRPGVAVVGLSWLTDSINRFARQPEAAHALDAAHSRYAAPPAAAAEARAASLRALLRNPMGSSSSSAGSSSASAEAVVLPQKAGSNTTAGAAAGAVKVDASASAIAAAGETERSSGLPAAAADAADVGAAASADDTESSSHGGGSSPGLSLHDSDWEDADPLDL